MKHKWANPTKLGAFVKKHKDAESPLLPDFIRPRDPVAVMVHSWLLWEASTEQAEQAMRKLLDAFVDYNEIRVSLPHEKATVVGKRYPRLEERLHGIRRTLHSLYLSRHTLSFDHLAEKGKRDIKSDIESLDGMHPFVAARMLRLSFDVHALPHLAVGARPELFGESVVADLLALHGGAPDGEAECSKAQREHSSESG